jgi:hypothetical protein
VVCPNRLGAINQVRLVLGALPAPGARGAKVVLVNSARPGRTGRDNVGFLRELIGAERLFELPWLRLKKPTMPISLRRLLAQLAA